MTAKLVPLPRPICHDVVAGLRGLADEIERGELGEVRAVAWIVDAEHSPVALGLVGAVPSPDTLFITLCEAAKLQLLQGMGK